VRTEAPTTITKLGKVFICYTNKNTQNQESIFVKIKYKQWTQRFNNWEDTWYYNKWQLNSKDSRCIHVMKSQKHPKYKLIIKNGLACQVDVA